jgi:hypothetical protein
MKRNLIWSFTAIAVSCCLFEMRNKAAYGLILMLVFLLYSFIVNRERRRIIYFCTVLPVWLYLLYRTSHGFEFIHHPNVRMVFLIHTGWLLGGVPDRVLSVEMETGTKQFLSCPADHHFFRIICAV